MINIVFLNLEYNIDLIMIADISLLKSPYYPYHLSWEEINNPGMVMQSFIQKWDLQYSRILLKKWEASVIENGFATEEETYKELKVFLHDFEKLIEAVFILRLQQENIRTKIAEDDR